MGYRSSALTDRKLGSKSSIRPLGRTPLLWAFSVPQPPLSLPSVTTTGTSPAGSWPPTWQPGSGPRPHPHLPFCSFSVDIILFWDLAFTLKSHHCHQGRNVTIFLLSKCDSWCHFPSCVALFSANPYVPVCILLGRKHQTQNGNWSCGSLWVFQGIW